MKESFIAICGVIVRSRKQLSASLIQVLFEWKS